ncbi:MAG TPA: 30S ribosomal protein S9 [archaeon]|nr:30S ribosomal protein S9 [archaeon]
MKNKKEKASKAPPAYVLTTGKRKRSIARAVTKPGKGLVKINSVPLNIYPYEMIKLRMMEPLLIAGDQAKSFDIAVNVKGGGQWGQADAVRQAIAKGLIEYLPDLKRSFVSYDRNLVVYDPRRTEPHKPPHSSWGPRRYKQRSKR